MADLDADDVAEALQTAAAFGGRAHPSHRTCAPRVASDRTVRKLRMRVAAFLEQLPGDLTIDELSELPGATPTTETDGDDE